jgi:hypothetical protein
MSENSRLREELSNLKVVSVDPPLSLQSNGHAQLDALAAIASNDLQRIKEELAYQVSRYESMKVENAKLLYKLLCCRGNLQVCCRIRPRNDQELANGAKTCLEVVDEAEIACFDRLKSPPAYLLTRFRRTLSWRTFQFDRVWDECSTQVFGHSSLSLTPIG